MYYIYVLKSKNYSSSIYVGYTKGLKKRMEDYNSGNSKYTSQRGKWDLVYYEAYKLKEDAQNREKILKKYGSSFGHLRRRIDKSLS